MKISVAVHGRFHGFDLASELFRQGLLDRLYTTYPAGIARRFLPAGIDLHTRPLLEGIRRLHEGLRLPGRSDAIIARQFARWVAGRLPASGDLLVGWSSATLEAIAPAKARGMKVVLERGSTHIGHQQDLLRDAFAEWGEEHIGAQAEIVERELAEYDQADAIAVPTGIAAESFIARGIEPSRLIVNPYGVSLADFAPPPGGRAVNDRPRILFAGRLGIRKGLPWLLEAFAPFAKAAELRLAGAEEPETASLLARLPMQGVTRLGALPRAALVAEMQAADLFCLPSLEEGLPLALLQALATGLPAIASRETGAETVFAGGDAGRIVPARDRAALTAAIGAMISDRAALVQQGETARAAVSAGFSLADYGARAVDGYRRLRGGEAR
ncbi:MAG: glycosyltransferase family 4 protein [Rhodospirillales bacterium]